MSGYPKTPFDGAARHVEAEHHLDVSLKNSTARRVLSSTRGRIHAGFARRKPSSHPATMHMRPRSAAHHRCPRANHRHSSLKQLCTPWVTRPPHCALRVTLCSILFSIFTTPQLGHRSRFLVARSSYRLVLDWLLLHGIDELASKVKTR